MTVFRPVDDWTGPSADPNDEQFGHVVEATTFDRAGAYDVLLVGEPYDGGVISRPGAAAAPEAIRTALAGLKTHHFATGPVGTDVRIGDLGDAVPRESTVSATQRAYATTADSVHEVDALPVFLGGDNSLTYANVRPLLTETEEEAPGTTGVVNFDAHLDVREVREDASSGTPYRQLLNEGLDGYACVGARHFETSRVYAEFVDEYGGTVVTTEEVGTDPTGAVNRALTTLGDVDQVYVSLDVDVLDAAVAPGVSAPTPGGLTSRELFRALRAVATDERVVGFEVVECAPPLDESDRTVAATARAIAHFLAGWSA